MGALYAAPQVSLKRRSAPGTKAPAYGVCGASRQASPKTGGPDEVQEDMGSGLWTRDAKAQRKVVTASPTARTAERAERKPCRSLIATSLLRFVAM